jgi:dTDP-4-amino-4,6-dideoxygalactose transaminase
MGRKFSISKKKFSKYFGVNHAIAVFNVTVALELCLKVIGVSAGDEVIVTARTFIASASCVTVQGATPIFIDVDPESQNITLEGIQAAVTSRTKVVILVHLAGWPCNVTEIVQWCHDHGIFVVEDCAQSHGAKYDGKYLGSFGDINAWSFCQDKIISTGGEGGMVTTNRSDFYLKSWSYKDHGKNYEKMFPQTPHSPGFFRWVHDTIGTNWRMTEIQASIGIDALDLLDDWLKVRRKAAQIFNETFKDLPLIRLTIPNSRCEHSYYKYYCFVRPEKMVDGMTRDKLIHKINSMQIPCFQGTCGQINKEKAYGLELDLPVTRFLSETSLMFLVDPSYSENIIREIANILRTVFKENSN